MRAVLCGYDGMGNGGDEALLATLLQMLPARVVPVVLSGDPQQTRDRYGVEAVPRKSLGAVFSALRGADAFIWGGGSLMQDASSALNPLYYGGLMKLAQLMGLKTVAWAQGIGPLNKTFSQRLTRHVLAHCHQVSVRDQRSEALLNRWHRPCLLAPDPVWALEAVPVSNAATATPALPAPRVAVALRPHRHLTPDRLALLAQALAQFQRKTNASLLLVPFQPTRDLAIAQTLANQLPGPHQIYSLQQPQALKGLFRDVDMVIGMRFHALVMAAAEGCKCFALSYDPKVEAIALELALPSWDLSPSAKTLPTLPKTPTDICQTWLGSYTHSHPLKPEQIQSRVDRALMHKDLLNEALKS